MSEQDAFLDGIAADRADRTRLLVFADWLADRGDEREAFVRLHARLVDMDGTEPGFAVLENQWEGWTGGVQRVPGCLPGVTQAARLDDRWLDAICRLFTAAEVAAFEANRPHASRVRVDREVFHSAQHIDDSWEEEVVFYRGASSDFRGPLDFAARTVLRDLWDDPFQTASAVESGRRYLSPVLRGGFWNRWRSHLAALRNPPPLPRITPGNHFLGAQYVEGDWNNWALVAMHQYDYFALFWSTTA